MANTPEQQRIEPGALLGMEMIIASGLHDRAPDIPAVSIMYLVHAWLGTAFIDGTRIKSVRVALPGGEPAGLEADITILVTVHVSLASAQFLDSERVAGHVDELMDQVVRMSGYHTHLRIMDPYTTRSWDFLL